MKRAITFLSSVLLALGAANPVNPTAPQVVPISTQPVTTGRVIAVSGADNLQAKYNAAACGDRLELAAGATFTGNFTFSKQCNAGAWIQIVSANLASISVPTYVTAANINGSVPSPPSLANYATIRATNGASPICFYNGSTPGKYHYMAGIEVTATVSQSVIVSLALGLTAPAPSEIPDSIIMDRLYVHGLPSSSTVQMTHGILMAGSNIALVNSYCSNIYNSGGGDANCVLGAFGGAGHLIQNNFLQSSAMSIFYGGTVKTWGYSCNIAASPAPTTTTATVSTCIDAASGPVSTPVVGTCAMFYIGNNFSPKGWRCVTGNTAGALTWTPALASAPDTGAGKVKWGELPTDITIRRNLMYKPATWNPNEPGWDGVTRASKNFVEFKYGLRAAITGNVAIYTWNGGQATALNINSTDNDGNCPWCVSSDVLVESNIWKYVAGAFGVIASQGGTNCPGPLRRVKISNNLFWPINIPATLDLNVTGVTIMAIAGEVCTNATSGTGVDSLQIVHNQLLGGGKLLYDMRLNDARPYAYTNLVIQDNLVDMGNQRWANLCQTPPDGTACVTSTLNTNNTYTISHNAAVNSGAGNGDQGASGATLATRYGSYLLRKIVDTNAAANFSGVGFTDYANVATNYMGFKLTARSVFHNLASDGTDPGVNFTALNTALGIDPVVPASQ